MHAADCECVVTDKKKSYRKHASKKAQTQVWMRLTTSRALQTETNCCDILGSFYEKKAWTARCCLGRGKLMGTPLRKWGQLTKAELQLSTTTALVDVHPPYFSRAWNQISSSAAAPALTFHAVHV